MTSTTQIATDLRQAVAKIGGRNSKSATAAVIIETASAAAAELDRLSTVIDIATTTLRGKSR